MPEHLPHPEHPPVEGRPTRPSFDLSTIHFIPVDQVEVAPEAEAMARDYLDTLKKDAASEASMAELAWALRR